MNRIKLLFLALVSVWVSCSGPQSQTQSESTGDPSTWSAEQVNQWFTEGQWLGGRSLVADSSINARELAEQITRHPERWDTIFGFLARKDLDTLSVGRYPLEGDDAFALVSLYHGRNADSAHFEEHHHYADVHMVASGEEYIERADTAGLPVAVPYNADQDIIFVDAESYSRMLAEPGHFFVFFPDDAHKASLHANDSLVRKIVVKVRVDD